MSARRADRSRLDHRTSTESASIILIVRLQICPFSQLCTDGCEVSCYTHRTLEQLRAAPSIFVVVIWRKPDKAYDASAWGH